jgi:hypothetical protein
VVGNNRVESGKTPVAEEIHKISYKSIHWILVKQGK